MDIFLKNHGVNIDARDLNKFLDNLDIDGDS